jgi:formate hydrogenlyase transcriptional activator
MRSSLTPDRSLDSQEWPTTRPESQPESERPKLLLDMTNALVSNLEPRDLLRAISASLRQGMHCDVVGVWRPDAQRQHLR